MRDGDIDMMRWNTCPENPEADLSGFQLSGLLNKIPLGGTASCPTCPVLIWKKKQISRHFRTLFWTFFISGVLIFAVCVCACGCNSGLTLRLADTA